MMLELPGYVKVSTRFGDALARAESVPAIRELDGIIFDCDGVLIDVSDSIQLVHRETARLYFTGLGWTGCEEMVEPEDVDSFKLAGGFNSDWHCAYSWLLLYLYKSVRHGSTDGGALKGAAPPLREFTAELRSRGGGLQSAVDAVKEMCAPDEWTEIEGRWDRESLRRLFVEVYSGDLCGEVYGFEPETVKGPGLILRDRPMLDRSLLPPGMKLGIATGRTAGETMAGVRLMGWEEIFPPEVIVSEDDGFRKPDPGILRLAVERLGAEKAIYVGDTPDDLLTVARWNESGGDMLSCAALSGHFRGEEAMERFAGQGADIIAKNVNAALAVIRSTRESAHRP